MVIMVVIVMRLILINWKYLGIENCEWGWDSLLFKIDVFVFFLLGVVVWVFEISLFVNLFVFLFDFFVVLGMGLVVIIFFVVWFFDVCVGVVFDKMVLKVFVIFVDVFVFLFEVNVELFCLNIVKLFG